LSRRARARAFYDNVLLSSTQRRAKHNFAGIPGFFGSNLGTTPFGNAELYMELSVYFPTSCSSATFRGGSR